MSISVDRRTGLSQREFEAEYVARSRPVILADAIDHWPARRIWNLDYFEKKHACEVVRIDGKDHNLGEFIASLKSFNGEGIAPYLKEVKLDEQFPELWADIGEINLAKGNRLKSHWLPPSMRIDRGIVALFIGTKGSGFRKLHWDLSCLHVFISQVQGAKEAILFHPDDTAYLYPNPEQDNQSLIPDPYAVDLSVFPDFQRSTPTHVTIAEGETLFLPGHWWHATRTREPNIAIAESTLDAHNWKARKDWYLDVYSRANVSLAKRTALNVYMTLLGAALGLPI